MKILFIGGTGIISSAVSHYVLQKGHKLYHYNRGKSHRHIDGVQTIYGDIRNFDETREKLKELTFDVVVNWINFVPEHVQADIELFTGKTKQYFFISSASAYQKPVISYPITENTPLENPYWQYSRDKIACENVLMDAHKVKNFPVTIVRPAHTYDNTLLPTDWGYTVIDRMIKGKKIIIPGDGTSLWVMTHNNDFAVGFAGLFGKQEAIGEAFHITSDELLTWNRIYQLMADELGVELNFVHIPSDFIAEHDSEMGPNLLGDKANSVIFDNSKIKGLVPEFKCQVPYSQGVKEIISWYKNNKDHQIIDRKIDSMIDTIISGYTV